MKATVDSGAAHSVIDGDDWPSIAREDSEGLRRGQVYLGPGSEKIPKRGQKRFKVKTEESDMVRNMTFRDAKVRRPLVAVSGCTDKGDVVWFDGKGSYIIPCGAAELYAIRKLVKQIAGKIKLEQEKGVFLMPVWVRTPKRTPGARNYEGFNRPGM